MKKVMVTIMALLVTAMIATAALAFGPGRGPGYGPCGRGDFGGFGGIESDGGAEDQADRIAGCPFQGCQTASGADVRQTG